MRFQIKNHTHKILLSALAVFVLVVSCENNTNRKAQTSSAQSAISSIQSKEHLNQIINASGDRLLLLEFYADWCPPCKELKPILEEIARDNNKSLDVYKINTDKHSDLARDFRVTGIPHVVFFKNKESVMTLSGLYPKQMYLKVIARLAAPMTADTKPGRQGGT